MRPDLDADKLRSLVECATLAPSFRNAQPWRFECSGSSLNLYADRSRRVQHADAKLRDFYISLGCALENLTLAATHFGFSHEIAYFPMCEEDQLVAQVRLSPSAEKADARNEALFDAITLRRTQHGVYDGRPLGPGQLVKLKACCTEPGLALLLSQDPPIRQAVEKMLLRADAIALRDPAYPDATAELDRKLLASTPAIGLISAEKPGRTTQVKAGRVLERIYLTATPLGLCVQPLSLLLEFDEVEKIFAKLFRAGGVPLLPFRLGYAERPVLSTPRRPLNEVLRNL